MERGIHLAEYCVTHCIPVDLPIPFGSTGQRPAVCAPPILPYSVYVDASGGSLHGELLLNHSKPGYHPGSSLLMLLHGTSENAGYWKRFFHFPACLTLPGKQGLHFWSSR